MLDVGIKETTTTTGTGTVTLSAVANHARVSQAFAVGGAVGYCLTSGNGDREWGIGIAGASNTLERTVISATLVGTTYTKNGSAISLTGTSELIVTEHGAASSSGSLVLKTPGGGSTWFCPYVAYITGLGTTTLSSNRVFYFPFQMQGSIYPLVSLGVNVTTAVAASTIKMAIYESKIVSSQLVPGIRIHYVSLDSSTTGNKTGSISFTPRPGDVYWIACASAVNPSVRSIGADRVLPKFGHQLGAINSFFQLETTGSTTPSDASGETFTATSSGSPPALFIGQ
jgi:hypothetical protein